MAWERRDGCAGRYYTRSRKVNGRVVREYVGTGPVAEFSAAHDADERARRTAEAARARGERERLAREEEPVAALDAAVATLTKAALVLAGYHQHDRGEWRRRKA